MKVSGVSVISGDHHELLLCLLHVGDQGGVKEVHLVAPEDADSASHPELGLVGDPDLVYCSAEEILPGEDMRFVPPLPVHYDPVDIRRHNADHTAGVHHALKTQQNLKETTNW